MNSCIVRVGRGERQRRRRRVRSRTPAECLIKDACVDWGCGAWCWWLRLARFHRWTYYTLWGAFKGCKPDNITVDTNGSIGGGANGWGANFSGFTSVKKPPTTPCHSWVKPPHQPVNLTSKLNEWQQLNVTHFYNLPNMSDVIISFSDHARTNLTI